MRDVWEWYFGETAEPLRTARLFHEFALFHRAWTCSQFPSKPDDMPSKKRAAYLAKVSKHAEALQGLLYQTRYDRGVFGVGSRKLPSDDSERASEMLRAVVDWGEDETGHPVTYWVDEDGVRSAAYDYPNCDLTSILEELISDCQRESWGTVPPYSGLRVERPNSATARAVFFVKAYYGGVMRMTGFSLPPAILATITNVTLQLPPDLLRDEDNVSKTLARWSERPTLQAGYLTGNDADNGDSDIAF